MYRYLEWLKGQLSITKPEEWNQITKREVEQLYGSGLLKQYRLCHKYNAYIIMHGSLIKALRDVLPEKEVYDDIPYSYWNDRSNRQEYLTTLSRRMKVFSAEDWYKVNMEELVKRGCKGLDTMYKGSLYHILSDTFPEQSWELHLFQHLSPSFWNDPYNHGQYLKSLESSLGVSMPTDWYKVNPSKIVQLGGTKMLQIYNNSLLQLLEAVYLTYR
jgi:hypothetical protein